MGPPDPSAAPSAAPSTVSSPGSLAASLSEAVGTEHLRLGGSGDAVGGFVPRFVARPVSTAALSALMRAATRHDLAVVPSGGGTRLSWGPAPERVDVVADTKGMAGVVEHVAGDLVVVVRAGTALDDLQAALARAGQRLAVDGHWPGATVGGLVAHGLSGPSRLGFGTLRDLLIGATFVRADGTVAHTGGKVVKNVAGYDLGKLLHGSWGTLGVLAEVVFRLHPRPPASRWVTATAGTPAGASALVQAVVQSQAVAVAVELDRPPQGPAALTVMLEGPSATIDARAAALGARLATAAHSFATSPRNGSSPICLSDLAPPWWGRLPVDPGGVLIRATTELDALPLLLGAFDAASEATGLAAHARGSAGVGSLMLGLPAGAAPDAVADLVSRLRAGTGRWNGSVVVLDGPPGMLGTLDAWGPVAGLELMQRVKEQFDPGRILSPGRFVGGI